MKASCGPAKEVAFQPSGLSEPVSSGGNETGQDAIKNDSAAGVGVARRPVVRVFIAAGVILGALGLVGIARGAAPPVWITDAPDIVNVTVLDSVSDATVGTVGPLVTDGSSKPAISPDGKYAYLPQILNGAVMRIDTGTLQFSLNVTGFDCPMT